MFNYIRLSFNIFKHDHDNVDRIIDFAMPIFFMALNVGLIDTSTILTQSVHCIPTTPIANYIITTISIFIGEITLEFYADIQNQTILNPIFKINKEE